MREIVVPRVLLAGVRSGAGKTLLGLGLAYELRRRNFGVSVCTVGPNLLQGTLYKRTIGRYVRCLDENMLAPAQVEHTVAQASLGADIVLIDGHAGLYDGVGAASRRASDAELAALTRTPTLLVVDTRGFGGSLTALVSGFRDFATDFPLVGLVLNFVSPSDSASAATFDFFAAGLLKAGLPRALGGAPDLGPAAAVLPPGGVTELENCTSLPRQFFIDLSNAINQSIDVEAVMNVARGADGIEGAPEVVNPLPRRTRIAVAEDACFNVCFQDNLDLLRFYGAELVPFSPLADSEVPQKIGGIYLPGGCLREYGAELAQNSSLLESLRAFGNSGGLVYAEGAGTALLCREFSIGGRGERFPGVGLVPGTAVLGEERLGYVEAVTVDESILGRSGLIIKGVTTNAWALRSTERIVRVLRAEQVGVSPSPEGISPGAQIVATFHFHHFGSNPTIARNLVDACEVVQGL